MGNQSKPEHPEGAARHTLAIPAGTMAIEGGAFKGRTDIVRVLIPDSVTCIEAFAFYNCSSLTGVVIPGSVTSIRDFAFKNCSSLTDVLIPDSVASIGACAFYNCSSLTGVVIPDSVTSIGSRAFYGCSSLTGVVIPDSVRSIGSEAFTNCSSLTSVVISDSVTSIRNWAFVGCSRDLTVDFGDTGQPFQTFDANRYSVLRGFTRTATCERPIPSAGPGACCISTHTWPPNSSAPAAGPPVVLDCVDGDGASLPVPMQDLSGDQYPAFNCWGPRTATAPDGTQTPQPSFKQLAAEQYPDALANPDEWEVVLKPDDPSPTPSLDLVQVGTLLVNGELDDLWINMVYLFWTELNPDSTTGNTVDPASSGAALAGQSTGCVPQPGCTRTKIPPPPHAQHCCLAQLVRTVCLTADGCKPVPALLQLL